ncbi:hypothetical protein CEXT_55081 [Caerostris extrusa]|uniref:Uncharacterized protein n=1 Tax=Caerostris extrusa TaxID=172846 RepID=A0AAV4R6S8_CAEEX|nr:hypothetical protein CEXT_55081 [Caerostris extrusa]
MNSVPKFLFPQICFSFPFLNARNRTKEKKNFLLNLMSWNDKRYWKSMNSKKMAKGPSTQKSQIVLSHFAIPEFKTEEEVKMSQKGLLFVFGKRQWRIFFSR